MNTVTFDSVGHIQAYKFLDQSLKAVGASRKTRVIFRTIYDAVVGIVRVRGLNGETIYSEHFDIGRGVIQGDIISPPIFFVLDMEQVFRLHDAGDDGVDIDNHLRIGVLGYADDGALFSSSPVRMTSRVRAVSKGSRVDDDMKISIPKTKVIHVERQEKIAPPSIEEIQRTEAKYTHVCKFCSRKCKTAGGLSNHMLHCNFQFQLTDKEYEVESINAVFGVPEHRWFRVQWRVFPGKTRGSLRDH